MVVKDLISLGGEGNERIVAVKYKIKEGTVLRWKKLYDQFGEDGLRGSINISANLCKMNDKKHEEIISLKEKEILEKEKIIREKDEEIEILKKAAAFLANLNRN